MLYYACPNNPCPNVKRAPENAGTCIKQVPTIVTGPFGVCINASTDLYIIKKIFAFGRKSWIKIVTLPPTEYITNRGDLTSSVLIYDVMKKR